MPRSSRSRLTCSLVTRSSVAAAGNGRKPYRAAVSSTPSAVIGCDNQDRDISDLGAAGTHGGERFMAWRIEESNLATLQLYVIGTDMLGDAAGFSGDNIRLTDGIQK